MSNSTAGLARSRIYISLYYDRGSIEFSLVSLATRYHRHVTMNVITPTRECHPASERNRVPLRFRAEHDPPWTHAINIHACVRAKRFSETSFRFRKRWSLNRVKWFWKRGGVIGFFNPSMSFESFYLDRILSLYRLIDFVSSRYVRKNRFQCAFVPRFPVLSIYL